jgi:peptidoglycan DL-endopeptidase CwlO
MLALASLPAACASTGAVPRPFPTPGGSRSSGRRSGPAGPAAVTDPTGIAATALALLGSPYRDGGHDPAGFDCSGFTQYVFERQGVALPRGTHDQFLLGRPVGREHLAAGDLVFFTTIAAGASHAGIALGGEQFVHAPSSTGVVRIDRLTTSYWSHRFVGARRVLGVLVE